MKGVTHRSNTRAAARDAAHPDSEVTYYVKKARKNGNILRPAELIRRNIALGFHAGARG